MALTAAVIIPSNRTEYIDETILSISKQTVRPKEVIICYDCYPGEEAAKINRAIASSTADAYILLGDDDKLHPQFFEKTLDLMASESSDIVSTDMEQFGDRPGIHKPAGLRLDVMHENFGLFYTTLVRKTLWERVGGMDPHAGPFGDWDFWWKCAETGAKVSYLPEPLFLYRTHPKQDSIRLSDEMCKWSREYILNKHKLIKEKPPRYKDGSPY